MAVAKTLLFVIATLLTVIIIQKYVLDLQSIIYVDGQNNYLPHFVALFVNLFWQEKSNPLESIHTGESFTTESLRLYDGSEDSKGLQLAFLGRVYDVSGKGDQHYAPGGGYSFFAGRDATRAFITGEFTEEGLKDDVDGFNLLQMGEVMDWVEFYETEYKHVGFIQGRYYDHTGQPTKERLRINDVFKEVRNMRKAREEERQRYPYCDVDIHEQMKRVTMSCVKLRSVDNASNVAIRVPRKYFKPGVAGWRCACVETKHLTNNDLIGEFEGCDKQTRECLFTGNFEGFYT